MDVSVPAQKSSTPHLNHVEGMRALAALAVYVNHAYAQANFPALWPFEYSLVWGHLAVTVFIVLSGFCLTLPVVNNGDQLRGGAKEFFWRRARRILPPYYAALTVALVLIWTIIGEPTGTLWDTAADVTKIKLLSHLLLMQDLFGTGVINYAFWSIAVEWHIYFLFPILVSCWRKSGPTKTIAGALVLGYGVGLAFMGTRVDRAAPHYLGMFTLGMLAAYVIRSPQRRYAVARERVPWGLLTVASLAITCALMGSWGWILSRSRFPILDFFVGMGAMSLLVLTSRETSSGVTRVLSFKPLVFIGTFSYSVYLLHAPLLQILWQFILHPAGLGPRGMFGALMVVGAPLVLGASYAFFFVFERPFIGSRRVPNVQRVERKSAELAAP